MKIKLSTVAFTDLPLQVSSLYSPLPPALSSSHTAWLSIPSSEPLHSCFLHLQCSSFLPPPDLSLNASLSEKPCCLPPPPRPPSSPSGSSLLLYFMVPESSVLLHVSQCIIIYELVRCLVSVSSPPPQTAL